MNDKVYGFYCVVDAIFPTKEEAWKVYDDKLEKMLFWIKGYKYWRHPPTLTEDGEFADNGKSIIVKYGVVSRITSTSKNLDGIKQILLESPYPKEQENGFDRILDDTYKDVK